MTSTKHDDARATLLSALSGELSVVHEIRNSLAVVTSSLYLAKRDREDPAKLLVHLERASREAEHAQRIATAVLELARGGSLPRESVSLIHVIAAAEEAASLPEPVSFSATIDPADLSLPANALLVERALTNLFVNAREALDGRAGRIEVHARAAQDGVEIVVEDDGPGLDETRSWFEPLVTTKATGTGLGLALVRDVALAHGGSVEASNRPPPAHGARFRFVLPAR
jgi:signal transduction histidine kinase